MKISIIIAVYNSAEFLRRILDCFIYQTIRTSDSSSLEVIVVNDCSPDPNDSIIIKEYCQRFPHIVSEIVLRNNIGVGGARNAGVAAAKGDFIQFADADDYADLTMCEKLYDVATKNNADIAVCGAMNLRNGKLDITSPVSDITVPEEFRDFTPQIWKMLIKRDFYISTKSRFLENVSTDDLVSILWFLSTDNIAVINEPLYYWIRRKSSVSRKLGFDFYLSYPKVFADLLCFEMYDNLPLEKKRVVALFAAKTLHRALCGVIAKYPDKLDYYIAYLKKCKKLFELPEFDSQNFKYGQFSFEVVKTVIEDTTSMNEMAVNSIEKKLFPKFIQPIIKKCGNGRLIIKGASDMGRMFAMCLNSCLIDFDITDDSSDIRGCIIENRTVKSWSECLSRIKQFQHVNVFVTSNYAFENIKQAILTDNPNMRVFNLHWL